jgi:hypothetical protein
VLLLYPLASIKWKRWMYAALLTAGISCLFLKDIYLKIVVFLYPSYDNTEYLAGGTSRANIVRCIAIFVFSLWFYREYVKDDRSLSFYFDLNVMASILYIFGSFLPVISRIGYYMTATHIFFVPALILRIKDEKKRKTVISIVILICIGYFALYMRGAADDGVRILPYQTFIFHELPPILSERGY